LPGKESPWVLQIVSPGIRFIPPVHGELTLILLFGLFVFNFGIQACTPPRQIAIRMMFRFFIQQN